MQYSLKNVKNQTNQKKCFQSLSILKKVKNRHFIKMEVYIFYGDLSGVNFLVPK